MPKYVITSSPNLEAVLHIINCKIAKDIWAKLQQVYESKTDIGIRMMHQQWYTMVRNDADNIATHVAKVEDLAHRLKSMGETV